MDLEDMFESFMKSMKNRGSKREVVRRIPMRPEWLEVRNRSDEMIKDMKMVGRKLDALKREFWYLVERDTECYENMRVSDDKKFVDVLANDDDDD